MRRHDEPYPAGHALDVAPAAEDKPGGEIYDALGVRHGHALQIDDHRDVMPEVLADGVGVREVLRLDRGDVEAPADGRQSAGSPYAEGDCADPRSDRGGCGSSGSSSSTSASGASESGSSETASSGGGGEKEAATTTASESSGGAAVPVSVTSGYC